MSLAAVRYISTSTVKPASHNEATQRIELTPWDLNLLLVQYIQKGLLFVKPQPGQPQQGKEEDTVINHLRTSLSRTLDYFFPLAGRLAITPHDDNTISVFLDCNGAGAEFIHATADITIADILDPLYVPHIVQSFFPLNESINYDGRSHPLLSVQATELTDGIFIGCTVNHTVSDGSSFWHFMNSWAEISRGSDHISRSPFLKRWFLNDTNIPIRLPFSKDEQFSERFTPPSLEERVFYFTPQNIARLKANANANAACGTRRISSLQALLAHIWLAVTRARCLDSNEDISYRLLMGNRARLHPPLPEDYFGNSIHFGVATAKVGELLERGHGWAASLLNQVVASYNDAVIRTSFESWVKKPVFVTVGSGFVSNALITGSSPRFNVYGNDFGWGRPVAVRSGCANKFDGKITVFAGPVEGSMDLEACLCPQTLKAMEDDKEFMEAVTILPPFRTQNV